MLRWVFKASVWVRSTVYTSTVGVQTDQYYVSQLVEHYRDVLKKTMSSYLSLYH